MERAMITCRLNPFGELAALDFDCFGGVDSMFENFTQDLSQQQLSSGKGSKIRGRVSIRG
jgi:hypothetical protein